MNNGKIGIGSPPASPFMDDERPEALEKSAESYPLRKRSGLLPESSTHHVFWTGGYDSTWLVLDHLKNGHYVQPVYMRHSPGNRKCVVEEEVQKEIRAFLGNPARLERPIVWDIEQLSTVGNAKLYWNTVNELAEALNVSMQYSALRFCRDITGFVPEIELGIVTYDELWERLQEAGQYKPVWKFFERFSMPILNRTKRQLWEDTTPQDQLALKMTFSCEESDKTLSTCHERKLTPERRCLPCKRRIEEMPR